ncbi:MAG: hypothetical protein LBR96_03775 [Treponema sp.]|jgi:hypothetical protein|nr:hypothetical protein [Treponema sp.]
MNGNSLLNLLPPVLRARDYRLYTRSGKDRTEGRIVDLWQAGGRAIMGHTPHLVLRDLKNTANRGLFSPLPHFLEGRLAKTLGRLLPGRNFRFYSSFPAEPGGTGIPSPLPDPAFGRKPQGGVSFWRPFLAEAPLSSVPVLFPILPGASFFPLWVTASLPLDPVEKILPPGDLIPPVVLAAVLRALNDLINSPERGRPDFPRIRGILPESPWLNRGIYLSLREAADGEAWEKFFRRFLEGGFLIPPGPAEPLILPGELSPGEEAALVSLLRFRP